MEDFTENSLRHNEETEERVVGHVVHAAESSEIVKSIRLDFAATTE